MAHRESRGLTVPELLHRRETWNPLQNDTSSALHFRSEYREGGYSLNVDPVISPSHERTFLGRP